MINQDKSWALVTGAGSGMGYCYARALAARRYNVLLVSNQDFIVEKAEQVQKDYGVQTIGLLRDLSLPNAAEELYAYCCSRCNYCVWTNRYCNYRCCNCYCYE